MPRWEVQLFAYLREKHGSSVTVESDPTVGAILDALSVAGINTISCRLAVGNEFVSRPFIVPEGSEIALIPPVSGG